jgi:hypothetical protein
MDMDEENGLLDKWMAGLTFLTRVPIINPAIHKSMKGILLRRALPSSPRHENSIIPNFQTGSKTRSSRLW